MKKYVPHIMQKIRKILHLFALFISQSLITVWTSLWTSVIQHNPLTVFISYWRSAKQAGHELVILHYSSSLDIQGGAAESGINFEWIARARAVKNAEWGQVTRRCVHYLQFGTNFITNMSPPGPEYRQRSAVLSTLRAGRRPLEISKLLNVPKSTVYDIRKRY